MSDLKQETSGNDVEPLLAVEKKLIGYSFGVGVVLLVVLVALNHFIPVKL